MRQTKKASLVESLTNIGVGFGIALVTQEIVFGAMGIPVSAFDNFLITLIFTVISIARAYTLRRVFEALRVRGLLP